MKKLVRVLSILLVLGLTVSSCALAEEAYWYFSVPLSALETEYAKLVNREMLLDADYEPSDLVPLTVKKVSSSKILLRQAAATALEKMFEDALAQGCTLVAKSGYRSYGTQKTMYNNRLEQNGGKDDGVVAYPGSSDHQTGLACDVLNPDYAARPRMTTDFGETTEAKWLAANCAVYGFIIRYPDGKQEKTGIIYEPWHLRFVGKEIAGYIMGRELTLEEFTDSWQVALAEFTGAGGNPEDQIALEKERKANGPAVVQLEKLGEDGDNDVSVSF